MLGNMYNKYGSKFQPATFLGLWGSEDRLGSDSASNWLWKRPFFAKKN